MKEASARRLEVGSRVCWGNNPKDGGTVIETGFNAVKVKWDDPSQGEVGVLYFAEMANIGSLPANRKHAPGNVTNLSAAEVGI